MSLTYDDLRSRIGHKAGYGLGVSSFDTDQSAQVEIILHNALNRVCDPPLLPGMGEKHQWSFLTPSLTLDLLAGQYAYDLPAQFVAFMGPIVMAPGQNNWYPPIELVGAQEVERRLAEFDSTSRPCIAGVRTKPSQGVGATAWELIVHPTPDADYQVKAPIRINPTIPGQATDPLPGGQPHELMFVRACIAETVRALVDEGDGGLADRDFMEALQASISHDLRVTGAQRLPKNTDPGMAMDCDPYCYDWNVPALTYQGTTW